MSAHACADFMQEKMADRIVPVLLVGKGAVTAGGAGMMV